MKTTNALTSLSSAKVAIVGAGLVGRLLAWQMSQSKVDITLYEANDLNCPAKDLDAAAFTAAGMIAPISEAIDSDIDIYKLGMSSISLWPGILQKLQQSTSQAITYEQKGSLVIAHPQDIAELVHFQRRVEQLHRSVNAKYSTLDANNIQELEPDISHSFQQGLLLPEEAHIDNRLLMQILLQQAIDNGVTCLDNTRVNIENNKVISEDSETCFDWVLDCRGIGAKAQRNDIRGVRGEVLRVKSPDISLNRPVRLMHPRYQLYLVPKPNNHFVIGATQIESEDQSPVSIQSMLELCSAMYSINPAFAEARIIEQNTNLRPALENNQPEIFFQDRHISINGLYRHGFLLAPAITECLFAWFNDTNTEHSQYLFRQGLKK